MRMKPRSKKRSNLSSYSCLVILTCQLALFLVMQHRLSLDTAVAGLFEQFTQDAMHSHVTKPQSLLTRLHTCSATAM